MRQVNDSLADASTTIASSEVVYDVQFEGEGDAGLYWREVFYAPVPDWVHYCIGTTLLLLMIVGAYGNSMTIYLFAT